jgi:hypothetical protein
MRIQNGKKFGSGIRDGKRSDPGSGIIILDPQHWFKEEAITGAQTSNFPGECKKHGPVPPKISQSAKHVAPVLWIRILIGSGSRRQLINFIF